MLRVMKTTPLYFPPYNWLETATIYNQLFEEVPYSWLLHNADTVVALFSARGVDYKGVLAKFYEIYENVKMVNFPIEVINVPMDEKRIDMFENFKNQANWFTLKFGDNLIPLLMYMYGVTSLPHLIVLRTDGSIVSPSGLLDLEEYGKNALLSWLSPTASTKSNRRLSKDGKYGPNWHYLTGTSSGGSVRSSKLKLSFSNLPKSSSTLKGSWTHKPSLDPERVTSSLTESRPSNGSVQISASSAGEKSDANI